MHLAALSQLQRILFAFAVKLRVVKCGDYTGVAVINALAECCIALRRPAYRFHALAMASSIQVVLPPTTYCSGSYVEGEVQFNFRHLQESEDRFERIWVTLRGRAHWLVIRFVLIYLDVLLKTMGQCVRG